MPDPAARPRCYRCDGWCYRVDDGWKCLPCGRAQSGEPRPPLQEERRQDLHGPRQGGKRL